MGLGKGQQITMFNPVMNPIVASVPDVVSLLKQITIHSLVPSMQL